MAISNHAFDLPRLFSLADVSALSQGICRLPFATGYGALVLAGIIFALAGMMLFRTLFTTSELIDNNVIGGFKFVYLAQIFASFFFFPLIAGAMKYEAVEQAVSNEAGALVSFDRLIAQSSSPNREHLRDMVRRYAKAVVEDEWQANVSGEASPEAKKAIRDIFAEFLNFDVKNSSDKNILELAREYLLRVVDFRQDRYNAVNDDLLPLVMVVNVTLALISLIFVWIYGSTFPRLQLLMSSILALAIVTVVYMSCALNNPLIGEIAVSNQPFAEIYEDL